MNKCYVLCKFNTKPYVTVEVIKINLKEQFLGLLFCKANKSKHHRTVYFLIHVSSYID